MIHGKSDPLLPVDGGIDTAKPIPGARLEWIDGMGHNLPIPLLPNLISAHSHLRSRSAGDL
ncbi:alpha/beta fold hydrolase [Zhongshania sp.]|uniref:alpha/beta fold hydrolase n=1 Tax=Zhongshania sp. TaxID=1971902 RepID=UPI00356B5135